ncbi:MAG: hypothetical protein HUJ42_01455 [Malacoplasma sp.]|nr:hypothetical protein [Malacoplasma sp.]
MQFYLDSFEIEMLKKAIQFLDARDLKLENYQFKLLESKNLVNRLDKQFIENTICLNIIDKENGAKQNWWILKIELFYTYNGERHIEIKIQPFNSEDDVYSFIYKFDTYEHYAKNIIKQISNLKFDFNLENYYFNLEKNWKQNLYDYLADIICKCKLQVNKFILQPVGENENALYLDNLLEKQKFIITFARKNHFFSLTNLNNKQVVLNRCSFGQIKEIIKTIVKNSFLSSNCN